jgi:hypothetical protein
MKNSAIKKISKKQKCEFVAVIFCVFLSSCSPKQDNNVLPRYSDMSAAEDAGKAK